MIYLASTSPRRRQLLKQAGIRYKLVRPVYREKNVPGLGPEALVKRHASEKGQSVRRLVKNGTILSADTIVYFKNKVIGKPRNTKEAVRILSKLQGQWHTVYTGVSLLEVASGVMTQEKSFCVKTRIFIKRMSVDEIRGYFGKVNPLDKAGAYAIQSKRLSIISKIQGSFSNAVGLPIEKLKTHLKVFTYRLDSRFHFLKRLC